ncbi:MAG: AAC(3) family N-acetyltransferase [Clostridiales bacterium]|jgi:aminoglycoside 3-N-acetyltransferase|nr:AAC(3) family N-acetyltransferase [Clostridiales bacterium]
MITYSDIRLSLEMMDVMPGDTLLMHSALTSIGPVEGGADTVIDAFLDAVGPEGTIVMSTLTGWGEPFDAATSPSAVGYISEVFRRRKGVLRSLHPVHSVAAYGKMAQYIVSGHEDCESGCGEGTPYFKLKEIGAKAVLLGVDMDRNTIMHSLEEAIDALYLHTLDIPAPTYRPDDSVFTLKKFPPGHRDFLCITPELRSRGLMKEGKIGSAFVKIVDIKGLFDYAVPMLKEDPLFFICKNEHCNSCCWSRLMYTDDEIDYSLYTISHCSDPTCEVCVVLKEDNRNV